MKIVAIKYCSAGNESVGDMWRETKIFEPTTPVEDIVRWSQGSNEIHPSKQHLEITVSS
ncbi:MAG: hypothetical protein M0P69_01615 [Bacteroidales bacterium]|nr:hypothetical protein [Bacteroidales bacterium]